MAFSMTGYGQGEAQGDGFRVMTQIRSVNHRYLDLSFRLPAGFMHLEPTLRARIAAQVGRGHLDVTVELKDHRTRQVTLEVDEILAQAYLAAANGLGQTDGPEVTQGTWALEQPGVVNLVPVPLAVSEVDAVIVRSVDEALDQLNGMREDEGQRLTEDISDRLRRLDALRGEVAEQAAVQPILVHERLTQRLDDLVRNLGDAITLDPGRLEQEAALLADKADVTEEVLRLGSHLQQLRQALGRETGEGRRMDFLLQEIHREINTIASKSRDMSIDSLTIDMKSLAEQMREQIQNLE